MHTLLRLWTMVSVATRFRIPYIIERLHSNIFCYNCDGGCRGGTLSRRLPESSSLYIEASFVTLRANPEVLVRVFPRPDVQSRWVMEVLLSLVHGQASLFLQEPF